MRAPLQQLHLLLHTTTSNMTVTLDHGARTNEMKGLDTIFVMDSDDVHQRRSKGQFLDVILKSSTAKMSSGIASRRSRWHCNVANVVCHVSLAVLLPHPLFVYFCFIHHLVLP